MAGKDYGNLEKELKKLHENEKRKPKPPVNKGGRADIFKKRYTCS